MCPARQVLYVDGPTTTDLSAPARTSDSIGYGITSSGAVRAALETAGLRVRHVAVPATHGYGRWRVETYQQVLDELLADPPDLVFLFHGFMVWPTVVRQLLLELGRTTPVVGYTHGSHWDPTDSVRTESYPDLAMADLANLLAMDRVLVVSHYMRDVLSSSVGALSADVAADLLARTRVVGLPIDTALLDAHRCASDEGPPTIVFNHAPVTSKHPDAFARVMRRVLRDHDARVVLTRRFPAGRFPEVDRLLADFPGRVRTGGDLTLAEYARTLWRADLQVSTATHESLGIATLEAMYTETCCLLPRLGSYPEITGDDPGALYPPGEDGLEERLRHLLDRPDERRVVGRRLRRAAARYAPGPVGAAVTAVLAEV